MELSAYSSPLGRIILSGTDAGLTGLWFQNQKYFGANLPKELMEMALRLCQEDMDQKDDLYVFQEAKRWLDIYFSGKEPDFFPVLAPKGTEFQKQVWEILLAIPYGEARTYGDIGREIAKKRGLACLSAQAVGGAVGKNPISIIIPCHRVLGKGGALTGYAGGLERKERLLEMEKGDCEKQGEKLSRFGRNL